MLISVVADRFPAQRHCNFIKNERNVYAMNGAANASDPLKRFVECTVPFYHPYYCCCTHFSGVWNVCSTFFMSIIVQKLNLFTMNLSVVVLQQSKDKMTTVSCFRFVVVGHFSTAAKSISYFRLPSFNCTWKQMVNKSKQNYGSNADAFIFRMQRVVFFAKRCYLIWLKSSSSV